MKLFAIYGQVLDVLQPANILLRFGRYTFEKLMAGRQNWYWSNKADLCFELHFKLWFG